MTLLWGLVIIPAAAQEDDDVPAVWDTKVSGALGVLVGLLAGWLLLHIALKDTDLSKPNEVSARLASLCRCSCKSSGENATAAQPPEQPAAVVSAPTTSPAMPATVVGVPISSASQGEEPNVASATEGIVIGVAGARPMLAVMTEHFKSELGVGGSSMIETIDAACKQLGVPDSGEGALARAETCWRILHGRGADKL